MGTQVRRITINGEKCYIKERQIIVKRGRFFFVYDVYAQVEEDDASTCNRMSCGQWSYCALRLKDLTA